MSAKDQIAAINKRTKQKILRTFRGTALSMFGRVVTRTPVDTGRARGNWQSSINRPLETIDPSTEGYATTVAQAQLGDSIFFINNLPYIKKLEDGSSDQAPAGMVKVTVAEFQSIAKRAARQSK